MDHPQPRMPLQVIAQSWTQLPTYDETRDGRPPLWVRNAVWAWSQGAVEIELDDIRMFIGTTRWQPAFTLCGVEWDWRGEEDSEVWTLVQLYSRETWDDAHYIYELDYIPLEDRRRPGQHGS